ncbi:hypothetical protein K9N68_04585 [Kovacikia minuta CCNUW1]|uniref:hypothetical protein n=1 Tax=Kovacikia minuta TaxID=2931930 RepID=UPI001CCD89FA|nr:hypothetical protein [Kovacikia minuta]UBF27247.1 hypothetical protein K9N68_04585 [Kovacikia minuta CCNUW1]
MVKPRSKLIQKGLLGRPEDLPRQRFPVRSGAKSAGSEQNQGGGRQKRFQAAWKYADLKPVTS